MAPSTVQSRGHRPRDWRMAAEVVVFTAPALVLFALFVVWPMIRAVPNGKRLATSCLPESDITALGIGQSRPM